MKEAARFILLVLALGMVFGVILAGLSKEIWQAVVFGGVAATAIVLERMVEAKS